MFIAQIPFKFSMILDNIGDYKPLYNKIEFKNLHYKLHNFPSKLPLIPPSALLLGQLPKY